MLRTAGHAVRLIQNDELLPAWCKCDFLLREALYPVAYDVDTTLVRGVEFENSLFIGVTEELACETEDGRGFADTRHARDDHMWHVTVFGNDLEAFNGFSVADDIIEVDGTVFLYPRCLLVWMSCEGRG